MIEKFYSFEFIVNFYFIEIKYYILYNYSLKRVMFAMKPFRYVLKSLFNNSVIIEGRKRKWIESFIIFIIAMIVALIPSIVTIASVKGSSILSSNANGADEGLVYFSETMKEKNIKFEIKEEDGTKIITMNDPDNNWANSNDPEHFYAPDSYQYFFYERSDRIIEEDGTYSDKLVQRLRVYLALDLNSDDFNKKVSEIQAQEITAIGISSFLIIGKTECFLCVYSKNAESWSSPFATRYMKYDRFKNGEVMSSYTGEHSLSNWKEFIDVGYKSTKIVTLFTQVGIYAAINVIISLFMVLMIFIITRGKHNPYRDYKFVEAMKIVGVASLSPAILSALIGFIFPSFSTMLFMVMLGIRIMWLTSRNLNPSIQQQ